MPQQNAWKQSERWEESRMKNMLCFIVFFLLPVAKLRPAVVGSTFSSWGLCSLQLRDGQPTTAGRSLAAGIMTLTWMLFGKK